MVTITLRKSRLLEKLKLTEGELEEVLFNLKSEIEPIDQENIAIEINADRLDMLSLGGIVRAAKGIMGVELGEPKYKVVDTDYVLEVRSVESRQYALGAVVYNVDLDQEKLRELIQFQEKLHDTIGRRRKKVAIGIHDLKKVDTKRIIYTTVPLNYKFVPLNQKETMTVSEVIEKTDQGKKYGNISVYNNLSPAILQEDGQVLSIPPVINSEKTKIEEGTKDVFIDVTGTNLQAVMETLDILVTNLAEEGGVIGRVKVTGTIDVNSSPALIHRIVEAKVDYISKRIGVELVGEDVVRYLSMMRMDSSLEGDVLKVTVPPYRIDIMRDVDLAEDVAMAIGYNKLEPLQIGTMNFGKFLKETSLYRAFRELSVGAGLQEIYSLVLTNSNYLEGKFVRLLNPISAEYDAVRNSLVWTTLKFLSRNQRARFPVKVFEIGEVVVPSNSDTGFRNDLREVMAVMDSKVSFEQLQSLLHQVIES
ncbi:MAG: phenylalanine--tRNA ligase subunit beta [Candidatus Aramenus sp.]|nr:phenylalanine--tRNA ligase subunit beta [Candidatus Aramenus sp.]